MGKLFGTDGIRGKANMGLTADLALRAGRACASFFNNSKGTLFIGRDTRVSGPMIYNAFTAGAMSCGMRVLSGDILPTPAVSFLTKQLSDLGVVISASHNPVPDNGIKLFGSDGYKLSDEIETKIEELIEKDLFDYPIGTEIGSMQYCPDASEQYVNFIQNCVNADLSGLKIALDCGYGAAWKVAPEILKGLGAEVYSINNEPDGTKINVNCGSTNLTGLSLLVKEKECDFGIALDGDADRCLMVDEQGREVNGDQIIGLIALYLKKHNALNENRVVTTVMSNMGFEMALKANGIELIRSAVGDRYVIEKMKNIGAVLGGEQSGHIILSQYNNTGDGTLTAAFTAKILKESGLLFSQLSNVYEPMPQILVNVKINDKSALNEDKELITMIESYEKSLYGKGRILLRPSGTESVARVMVEGINREDIENIAGIIVSYIEQNLN